MGTFPLPSWGHCGDDSLINDLAFALPNDALGLTDPVLMSSFFLL
jgi:hypothetical protein